MPIIAGPIDELEADQRIGGWRATRRVTMLPPRRVAPPRAGGGGAAAPVSARPDARRS
ncbi:hypothetical protein WME76_40525 [Sorangium sp. So ce119]|uniref:hypothetical protein n=1 Tax=Sorangium sp. So ce119 TaxID=3133279 RepID=UPI003F625D04